MDLATRRRPAGLPWRPRTETRRVEPNYGSVTQSRALPVEGGHISSSPTSTEVILEGAQPLDLTPMCHDDRVHVQRRD
jgi:hypothetical protein